MVLREVREMPEADRSARIAKADLLTKLAEIYEVLRAAKMPRLEAVRIALMSEAGAFTWWFYDPSCLTRRLIRRRLQSQCVIFSSRFCSS